MKVKILTSHNPQDLENQVNNFIKAIQVQEGAGGEWMFHYSTIQDSTTTIYSVLIAYK